MHTPAKLSNPDTEYANILHRLQHQIVTETKTTIEVLDTFLNPDATSRGQSWAGITNIVIHTLGMASDAVYRDSALAVESILKAIYERGKIEGAKELQESQG